MYAKHVHVHVPTCICTCGMQCAQCTYNYITTYLV